MPPADAKLRLLVRHSAAPKDVALTEELLGHLKPLQRFAGLDVWSDHRIKAGDETRREIERAIDQADVVLLLLSIDFFASDTLLDVEVPKLMERHRQGSLKVVPVLLRSCLWEAHPWLSELRPLPMNGKPIASHQGDERDRVLTELAKEIAGLMTPSPSAGTRENQEAQAPAAKVTPPTESGSTYNIHITGSNIGGLGVGPGVEVKGQVVEQHPAPATTTVPDRSVPRSLVSVDFINFGPDAETDALLAELGEMLSPLAIDVEGAYGLALSARLPVFATVRFANATANFLDEIASKASALSSSLRVHSERIQRVFEEWHGFGFRIDMKGVEHSLSTDHTEDLDFMLAGLRLLPAYWTAWGQKIPILIQPGVMHRIYWCHRDGHWFPVGGLSRTPRTNEDFREHWTAIQEIVRHVVTETPHAPDGNTTLASVYLSYGDDDLPAAHRLYEALELAGVPVFFRAEHAVPGAHRHRSAKESIREYEHVILLCSQRSLSAPSVMSELDEMLSREFDDGASERIIPILLDDYASENWQPRHPDIRRAVLDRVTLDMKRVERDGAKFEKAMKRLLGALKA